MKVTRCCTLYEPKYNMEFDVGFGEIQKLQVCEYHANLNKNWTNHVLKKEKIKN